MCPGFAGTKTARPWPFQSGEHHHSPASTTDLAPPDRIIRAEMAGRTRASGGRRPSGHRGAGHDNAPFRANETWVTGIRPVGDPRLHLVKSRLTHLRGPHLGARAVTRRAARFSAERRTQGLRRRGTSQEENHAERSLTAWAGVVRCVGCRHQRQVVLDMRYRKDK